MDLTRMRYFLAVADELHFARAAEKLRITPSPLSKQIQLFEREMGGPLFVRTYHDVRLTELGHAIHEPVREILEQVAELKALASEAQARSPALRHGSSAHIPDPIMDQFVRLTSDLRLAAGEVWIGPSSSRVAEEVQAGRLDVGLVHVPLEDSSLAVAEWDSYPMGIAMRSDDALAAGVSVSPGQLVRREIIVDSAPGALAVRSRLAERLAELGVHHVVTTGAGAGSEAEVIARVRHSRVLALVANVPGTTAAKLFTPPEFTVRRLASDSIRLHVGVTWSKAHMVRRPALRRLLAQLLSLSESTRATA